MGCPSHYDTGATHSHTNPVPHPISGPTRPLPVTSDGPRPPVFNTGRVRLLRTSPPYTPDTTLRTQVFVVSTPSNLSHPSRAHTLVTRGR